MLVFRSAVCALLLFFCADSFAARVITIASPDGRIKFTLSTDNNGLFYRVTYKGALMVDKSRLDISFKEGGSFNQNLQITTAKTENLVEDYTLVGGKSSKVHSDCNRVLVPVTELTGDKRVLNIEVRVFNDGAAFRYLIPKQGGLAMVNVTDEINTFNLTGNPKVTALLRENFTTSHEGIYTKVNLDKLKADTLMDMPALFEFKNGNYMAITEAALLDYAGMYLIKHNVFEN